jgi:MFS family permease
VPLYGVYALLFRDHGLSVAQVSTLFVIWSLTSFVFEVPSGAWADTVDRRLLLVLSALVYAVAFSCWLVFPTYAGFATGFVLWGLSGSLASGTFEALVYDELTARGLAGHYPRLIGWCNSAAMTANLTATALAAPMMAVGGYALVGWSSVAIALGQAALAAWLPGSPRAAEASVVTATESSAARYLSMLRTGLMEAGGRADVRRVVAVSSVLVGLTAYDEYFPLVAQEHGVATTVVPVLVAVTVVGQVVGTALAGRTASMSPRAMSAVVAAGAVALSLGALRGDGGGFVAIALGYGLLNNAMLVSEARLQQVITGPARATVTSVSGLATEVVALAVSATFAVATGALSVSTLVAALGVPTLLAAVAVRRWLPPASAARDRELG